MRLFPIVEKRAAGNTTERHIGGGREVHSFMGTAFIAAVFIAKSGLALFEASVGCSVKNENSMRFTAVFITVCLLELPAKAISTYAGHV